MTRNYNDAEWVFVVLSSGISYVFPSRIRDSLRDDLGQALTSTITSIDKVVVTPQSPKPKRATKQFATGSQSSYCSDAKIPDLKQDGWTITRSKTRRFSLNTANAEAFKATINGIKYAWQSAKLPTGVTLGITDPRDKVDANDTLLVWGADFPKPPTFTIVKDGNSISSYFDPSKTSQLSQAGAKIGGGQTTLDVFQQLYV